MYAPTHTCRPADSAMEEAPVPRLVPMGQEWPAQTTSSMCLLSIRLPVVLGHLTLQQLLPLPPTARLSHLLIGNAFFFLPPA